MNKINVTECKIPYDYFDYGVKNRHVVFSDS